MNEWFNAVENALLNRPEVRTVAGEGVTESNKVLSPTHVGGCFCQTFRLDLEPEAEPDPWNLTSLAATLESGIQSAVNHLLTADDDPVRLVAVEMTGHGKDRSLVGKAYIIPDPE